MRTPVIARCVGGEGVAGRASSFGDSAVEVCTHRSTVTKASHSTQARVGTTTTPAGRSLASASLAHQKYVDFPAVDNRSGAWTQSE